MSETAHTLYTVGYAAFFRPADLVACLRQYAAGAVVDVRAFPEMTSITQYRGANLAKNLREAGIHYLSFAREFGVRPQESVFYTDDAVDFGKIAASEIFKKGCDRLEHGLQQFNVCLLCAEKDPSVCHRAVLITHAFRKIHPGIAIRHITPDGLRTEADIEAEICKRFALFADSPEDCYAMQARQIAWRRDNGKPLPRPPVVPAR